MGVEERATLAATASPAEASGGSSCGGGKLIADPGDTRQPCWLERRQALSYMDAVLARAIHV